MNKRILVVEDGYYPGEWLKEMLRVWDYEVDLASTLETAIRRIQSNHYDIIISDNNLDYGGNEGLHLLYMLREGKFGKAIRKLPFILLTAEIYLDKYTKFPGNSLILWKGEIHKDVIIQNAIEHFFKKQQMNKNSQ